MVEEIIKNSLSSLIENNSDDKELLLEVYKVEMSFLNTLKTLENRVEIAKIQKETELQKVSLELGLFIEEEEN
jgi:hypothetical protein